MIMFHKYLVQKNSIFLSFYSGAKKQKHFVVSILRILHLIWVFLNYTRFTVNILRYIYRSLFVFIVSFRKQKQIRAEIV